jgi:membrane-bound lytic murein transglycosylase D
MRSYQSPAFVLGAVFLLLSGCQNHHRASTPEAINNANATPINVADDMPLAKKVASAVDDPVSTMIAESAPVNTMLAKPDGSIWPSLRSAMGFDHQLQQKRVRQEIVWLSNNPKYLERLQPRLQKYLPYILERTVERGLPGELALIPIVESALDPYAFSPGGASGPWQFMRPTALEYGLTIDRWYDGRRDIVAATEAALDYLEVLRKRLDHWPLAVAAYNAGGARVQRAVKRANSTDFFALKLPRETQYYLPKILALAAVISAPEDYSISLPDVINKQSFTTLVLPSQFDLQVLSQHTKLSLKELKAWNPALKRWATAAKDEHHLIVPLEQIGQKNNLLDITTLQDLVQTIRPNERMHWQEITVRRGDSLSVLAQRYNTDITTLKFANKLRSNTIRAGRSLLVPTHNKIQITNNDPDANQLSYTVQPGDSLWSIAKKHNISIASLVKTNRIAPRDILRVGRTLTISAATPVPLPTLATPPEITRKIAYTVRVGDSLARIAERFGVGITDLAKWNSLEVQEYLQPGQRLTVYVDAVNT